MENVKFETVIIAETTVDTSKVFGYNKEVLVKRFITALELRNYSNFDVFAEEREGFLYLTAYRDGFTFCGDIRISKKY